MIISFKEPSRSIGTEVHCLKTAAVAEEGASQAAHASTEWATAASTETALKSGIAVETQCLAPSSMAMGNEIGKRWRVMTMMMMMTHGPGAASAIGSPGC